MTPGRFDMISLRECFFYGDVTLPPVQAADLRMNKDPGQRPGSFVSVWSKADQLAPNPPVIVLFPRPSRRRRS